jgi:CBS domain-containing protein
MNHEDSSQLSVLQRGALENAPVSVADVMTQEVMTLGPQQTFADTVALMANRFFRHVLVVDEDQRLCGVISDRDILRALARTLNWKAKSISEIMTRDVFTVAPETRISIAIREMLTNRISCLPVIGSDGRVCGIVTSTDLLTAYEKIQCALERPALPSVAENTAANR